MDGGEVEVDGEGRLTGILKERAVEPVINALSTFKTHEHRLRFLKEGMALCVNYGLTSVQTNDEACLDAYLELQQRKELPLRIMLTPTYAELTTVVKQLNGPVTPFPHKEYHQDLIWKANDHDTRLGVERLKIFSDGSLGADTAAISLLDQKDESFKGILIHEANDMQQMIENAMKAKFRLEIHAIGDAAASQVLNAMEAAKKSCEAEFGLYRPILTHCQVLRKDLVSKMAELNVIANVQPPFVPTGKFKYSLFIIHYSLFPTVYLFGNVLFCKICVGLEIVYILINWLTLMLGRL